MLVLTRDISAFSGVEEGNLGAIRYFGILPQYRGVLIGDRLLRKVEKLMVQSNCCRSMACVADARVSMREWLQRRDYSVVNNIAYPSKAVGHNLIKPTTLLMMVKPLNAVKEVLPMPPTGGETAGSTLPPIWRAHVDTQKSNLSGV